MEPRLYESEKKALKYALRDFDGEIYIFGSRLNPTKNGGDIDILLVPSQNINPIQLCLKVQSRFFAISEQDIDVIVYDGSLFCREILKNAKRIDIKRI